jgi:hyaluronoglucosaminidase
MKRQLLGSLIGVAVILLTFFGLSATAGAAPYTSSGVTLSVANPAPGGSETISASGYQPGSQATFLIFSSGITLGNATVNANGVVQDTVTVPSSLMPGSAHTFEVQGTTADGAPLTQTASVTLAGGSSNLAFTGAQIGGMVAVGAALIAAGGALLFVRRRRQAQA